MNHEENNNSAIFGVLAFAFKIAGLFTVSQLMSFSFSFLSVISVSMIIVINWDKFMLRIRKTKKKKR